MNNRRATGFWTIMIVGFLLLIIIFIGQTMAFINYDFTVSIGMQEPTEEVTEFGVAMNKGFGAGDTIIYIPLLVLGLIGLWQRKKWGVFTMAGTMAITAYWPMVTLFIMLYAKDTPGFNFTNYTLYTVMLTVITLYGLWAFWYLYKNHERLASD